MEFTQAGGASFFPEYSRRCLHLHVNESKGCKNETEGLEAFSVSGDLKDHLSALVLVSASSAVGRLSILRPCYSHVDTNR